MPTGLSSGKNLPAADSARITLRGWANPAGSPSMNSKGKTLSMLVSITPVGRYQECSRSSSLNHDWVVPS